MFLRVIYGLVFVTIGLGQNKAEIKSSLNFYWGEASSESQSEASKQALKFLTQKIAVTVESSFQVSVNESEEDYKKTANNVLETYSLATLKDFQTITEPSDEGVRVFHYIQKSAIAKIFEERKTLIYNLYQSAQKFERDGNIADALKWNYYAIILMNSIPEQSISVHGENLTLALPQTIHSLIQHIELRAISDAMIADDERVISFKLTHKNKPISKLAFSFWDGSQYVDIVGKDGIADIRLFGSSVQKKKADVRIKYKFHRNRNEFAAVAQLWDFVSKPSYPNTKKITFSVEGEPQMSEGMPQQNELITNNSASVNSEMPDVSSVMKNFTEDLKRGTFSGGDAQAKSQFDALFKHNNVKLVSDQNVNVSKTADGWEVRGLRVQNAYPSLNMQQSESLNLDVSKTGEITGITYGMMGDLFKKYVGDAKDRDDFNERQIIVKFLERYRTAYMTRDIGLIKQIFSDDALIIIGKKVNSVKTKDLGYQQFGNQPSFEYVRLSKEAYVNRLAKTFENQKDIYLEFSTFKILQKNNQKGVYGVSMRQNYYSSSYSDEGHLFLLIDFNGDEPKIYVRSWQPQEWDDANLIGMANFKIHK